MERWKVLYLGAFHLIYFPSKNLKRRRFNHGLSRGRETTQKYSTGGSSAMLFTDTNFISDENNLDAITEKKYSVVNISAASFDSLAQTDIPTIAPGT